MAASFFGRRARPSSGRSCAPLVSRGHFTHDRAAKKNPACAGLSVACLCGGASSRCYSITRCSASCFCSGPGIFFVSCPGSLLPKGAAVPLMNGYEQHPCQRAVSLKGCDMLRCRDCTNVTQCTIRRRLLRSNPTVPAHGYDLESASCELQSGSARQECKNTRQFRSSRVPARRPSESQTIEFH